MKSTHLRKRISTPKAGRIKKPELIILRVLGEGDEDVVAAVGSEIRGHLGSKEVRFDVREDRDSHCGFVVRVVLLPLKSRNQVLSPRGQRLFLDLVI